MRASAWLLRNIVVARAATMFRTILRTVGLPPSGVPLRGVGPESGPDRSSGQPDGAGLRAGPGSADPRAEPEGRWSRPVIHGLIDVTFRLPRRLFRKGELASRQGGRVADRRRWPVPRRLMLGRSTSGDVG